MRRFYIRSDVLNMLSSKKKKKDFTEEEENLLRSTFRDAGIIDQETLFMDPMAEELLNNYFLSKNRVILHFYGKEYRIHGFYFTDDLITMVSAYKDAGEFLWIPSGNYIIGVLADILKNVEIGEEKEELKGEFISYCSEDNYREILAEGVIEERYKDILKNSFPKKELWMRGKGSDEEDKFFICVVFQNQKAYYYRQENRKFTYGCADEVQLIGILSNWMLKKHRELIMKMRG